MQPRLLMEPREELLEQKVPMECLFNMSEAFVGNCPNFAIFVRVTHCLTISSWGMFFFKWFIFTEKRFLFKSNSFFQCVSTNTLRRQLSSVNETAGVWIEAKALHHIPWWRGTRLWRSCKVKRLNRKSTLWLFTFWPEVSSFFIFFFREWFFLLSHEVLNPMYCLFEYANKNNYRY